MPTDGRPAERIASRISDIREAIASIRTFTKGMARDAFLRDEKTESAVARKLLVIAEGVDAIFYIERKNAVAEGERLQERLPDIPWRSIRAMGILIRHGYRRESPEEVWSVIADGDLDTLECALESIA